MKRPSSLEHCSRQCLPPRKAAACEIVSGRRVTGLLLEGGRCTGVLAGEEKIRAEHVVIAAGCFSAEIFSAATGTLSHATRRRVRCAGK